MSKLRSFTDIGNIQDVQGLVKYLSQVMLELQPLVNGKIEFDDNIKSKTVTTYFQSANTDVKVGHGLNKIVSYLVINKTASTDIYHGTGTDTNSYIWLRSTVAGVTVTLILI